MRAAHAPRLIGELLGAGAELFEVALSNRHGLVASRAVRAAFGPGLLREVVRPASMPNCAPGAKDVDSNGWRG